MTAQRSEKSVETGAEQMSDTYPSKYHRDEGIKQCRKQYRILFLNIILKY